MQIFYGNLHDYFSVTDTACVACCYVDNLSQHLWATERVSMRGNIVYIQLFTGNL